MNLEGIKNIRESIESENSKERREKLLNKIEQISLVYAEKKFQEVDRSIGDCKFSEIVRDFTPTENIISSPTFRLESFVFSRYKDKIKLFLDNFYEELDSLYESSGFDLDKISGLVDAKRSSIKEYLGVNDSKDRDSYEDKTKLIKFNQINNIKTDADKKYQDLDDFGFSEFDEFLEVHVEDFFNIDEKNLGMELIKSDLAVLAKDIVDYEPQTAAVIGRSWLLSTPLAGQLGFKRMEGDNQKQNDFSTWLQFIDKDGQINQKRFNKFLETEELPFKSVRGYIPTEEFLRRYLPDDRRGKIVLKEINKDWEPSWDRIQKEFQLVRTDWDDLLKDNGNFSDFMENHKIFNEVLELTSSENQALYFDFLAKMFIHKIPWDQFYEQQSLEIRMIDKQLEQLMHDRLYRDKEVVID